MFRTRGKSINFVSSLYDAAAGRFSTDSNTFLTRKDKTVLQLNINKLGQLLPDIEENYSKINLHNDNLLERKKLTLRHEWQKSACEFDKEII